MNNQLAKNKNTKFSVEKEYITIFDLAHMISVPVGTLRNWLYRREMPLTVYKPNTRHVRFNIQEVKEWMKSKKEEPRDSQWKIEKLLT